jgi:hypothetical protein
MFDAELNPEGISKADLVVCILSYNGADSISDSTRQASEGLVKYFSDKPSVIVNFDSSSTANTKGVFLGTRTEVPRIYLSLSPGAEKKGGNWRNLFRKLVELGAKGIMVFEARLNSITPERIRRLGEPLFNGFSYVAPLHTSRRYDGTITNAIAYPIFRTLYGRRIRQPMGKEFSFSGDLAGIYVEDPLWDLAVTDYGNHMWMTAVALTHGARVCQSFMGNGRVLTGEDPSAPLSLRFEQDVETIFFLMNRFESHWLGVKYSRPTAVVGFGENAVETAARSSMDSQSLFIRFQDGFSRFEPLWGEVFSNDVFLKLREIKGMKQNVFDFPTELWARILYEMSVACRDRGKDSRLLIRSLIPLFWGKTFCFMKKTSGMAPHQIEGVIEEDCMIFEMTKPYLIKRWTEGHKPASPERP